jgi:mannose-6-phosphate isomerase
MNTLYPLKFIPLYREKLWGGKKLKELLGLDIGEMQKCGEAWVLSGVKDNETIVSNGFLAGNELNELVEVYMDDLVGGKVYEKYKNEFPVLVKFIDASEYLSIQVHPDDKLAMKRGLGNGKTEMWYIIDADKDAELISGFSKKVTQKTFLDYLNNKNLIEILNVEKVNRGDIFFMPAGRVHAIGPGVLLAEIQQSSDTTYRIYDWGRVDEQGRPRDLHTREALEAIDFDVYDTYRTKYARLKNQSVEVVDQPYFTTNMLHFDKPLAKEYEELDSFVIYTCVQGSVRIVYPDGEEKLNLGECILIPNLLSAVELHPSTESKLLETFII